MFEIRGWTAALLGVLLVATLSGWSDDHPSSTAEGSDTTTSPAPATTPVTPATPDDSTVPEATTTAEDPSMITITEAMDVALDLAAGEVVAGGRTDEEGQDVWYVTVRSQGASGTEIYVDTADRSVVDQQPETLDPAAAGTPPDITAQAAIDIARRAVPGTELVEFDLEREDGLQAWYVFLRGRDTGQQEVYIDAASGEVISRGRG